MACHNFQAEMINEIIRLKYVFIQQSHKVTYKTHLNRIFCLRNIKKKKKAM